MTLQANLRPVTFWKSTCACAQVSKTKAENTAVAALLSASSHDAGPGVAAQEDVPESCTASSHASASQKPELQTAQRRLAIFDGEELREVTGAVLGPDGRFRGTVTAFMHSIGWDYAADEARSTPDVLVLKAWREAAK